MEGLAFQLNSLTFSATNSTSTYEKAGRQHHVTLMLKSSRQALLRRLISKLFTPMMAQAATKRYPQFTELIDLWLHGEYLYIIRKWKFTFGEAKSIWDDFIQHLLELISEHPRFAQVVNALPNGVAGEQGAREPLRFKNAHLQTWLILDHPELERLSNAIPGVETQHPYKNTCYNYSAAAVALRFLASCTDITRSAVRKIILVENHVSIAQPEPHSRGFIQMCRENIALRIERYVSLWRTVFPVGPHLRQEYIIAAEQGEDDNNFQDDGLLASGVTNAIGRWVTEALALQSLGMPKHSHTLVLDGDPIPEHTAKVFRIVQRDAAWQAAFEICLSGGVFESKPLWLSRRLNKAFGFRGLPEMIRTLSTGGSPISCNFQLSSYDVDEMIQTLLENSERHHGWRLMET